MRSCSYIELAFLCCALYHAAAKKNVFNVFAFYWKVTLITLVFRYISMCVCVALYYRYLMLLCRNHLLGYSNVLMAKKRFPVFKQNLLDSF